MVDGKPMRVVVIYSEHGFSMLAEMFLLQTLSFLPVIYGKNRQSTMILIFCVVPTVFSTPRPLFH